MKVAITLSPRDYDAVLFDLDGVLTKTARVHAAVWKKLFDKFLERRATQNGEPFVPFAIETDYPRYVDGKPRYDGVVDFLASRGIELPFGASEDGPEVQSVHALGNLKDRYFMEHLEQQGVESYESAIELVRQLRAQEIKTAVVSSSNNCAAVLESAGITQLFEARVDGRDLTRLQIKGKPAPDAFLEAARRVGVAPTRAVVVEDAVAGVEAGRAGQFGCVIGVDRGGHGQALSDAGANVVVTDMAQVRLAVDPPSSWTLTFAGFDPAKEGIREALCTLGNGYFATRGAATWVVADDIHYPGTYLAGGYNRLRTDIMGRMVENEASGYIGQELKVEVQQGQTLVLEKMASLYTGRDHAISECGLEAQKMIARTGRFDAVLANHILAWKHLWRRFDVHVRPADPDFKLNVPMLLRLNMLHLLQAVSINSIGLDIGVPARGWTGEAYQGHVFWDELFIFPFFNYRMPEITRSLLMYRYRRLGEARVAATVAGYRGAMFPWQSGSDGQEETESLNLNPRSERWVQDNSYLQRHVGSAIVYNVWQYFQVTRDIEFLHSHGAELVLDIARFWSSIAHFNEERGRYEIHGVMGPDEFHDRYPDSTTPGLNNNAYTNLMAAWVLCRAQEVLDLLSDVCRSELTIRLGLSAEEIARWGDISHRMFVPFHDDGIICQFEGYEQLAELDWEAYRNRYGNIQRLDLILEGENDSANRYKLSKQPDVMMLFYLFSAEELSELFKRLGYPFKDDTIPRNIAYYRSRSSHGSTLSRVVYAWVLARSDRPRAMDFFAEALRSDVSDVQQGTTAEGVHLGAMAGTVDQVQRVSTGIEVRGDILHLNPELPQEMERLDLRIRYRGHSLDLRLTRDSLTVRGHEDAAPPISLSVNGTVVEFITGTTRVFPLATKTMEKTHSR